MKTYTNRFVTLGVTLFLLIVGINSISEAQIPIDCESDPCYQTQSWSGTLLSPKYYFGPMPDCNDCWVQIAYKTRNNSSSPGCQTLPPIEYQLLYVVVSGSCYYSPCNHYPQFDIEQAYKDGMAQFLNTLGYSPVPPATCGPSLEGFTIISCFREDTDLEGNILLRACYNFTCCKKDLKLCYENGELVVKSENTESEGDCSEDPYYPDDCMTICDWIDDAVLPKEALLDTRRPTENPLTIIPNPLIDDVLNFSFNSDFSVSDLYVIDPQGKIIIINKNDFIGDNTFRTGNLISGSYILVVKTTNDETHYCNFILNK